MRALLFSLSSCHFQATITAAAEAPIAHQTDDEEDQTVATVAPADATVEGKPPINTQIAKIPPKLLTFCKLVLLTSAPNEHTNA